MDLEELIDHWLEMHDGDVSLTLAARDIIEEAEVHHPAEMRRWLKKNATQLVQAKVHERMVYRRTLLARRTKPQLFAELSQQFAAGEIDSEDLIDLLDIPYSVVSPKGENIWRRLGDMDADDCLYVAQDRERRAKSHLLEAAFMRALANRIGTKTVGAVFSAERLGRAPRTRRTLPPAR